MEIKRLSGAARQRKGRAILGLSGRDHGTGLGGTYLVKFVRAEGMPDTEISIGDIVLASKGNPNIKEAQAVVIEKSKYSITIAYNHTPPYFVYQQNIRLDLFANDITFQRMADAVKQLIHHRKLLELLLLQRTVSIADKTSVSSIPFFNRKLNESQKNAIADAIAADDIFLIHGPPGTGKTTTLEELITQLTRAGKKVLATADSNTAVDNLLEKLLNTGIKVVRIGNPARINDDLLRCSLDYQVQDLADYQQAISLRDQAGQLKEKQKDFIVPRAQERRGLTDQQILKLATQKSGGRGVPDFKIRKMAAWIKLQQQINKHYEEAGKLEIQAIESIITQSDVICATNSAAGSDVLHTFRFDVAVLDEASQSTEPACLIPMLKASKWIMAGDHKQLPPTVLNEQAKALSNTLFERWMLHYGDESRRLLAIQYRMHETIMRFSNEQFYEGKLRAHPSVAHRKLSELTGFLKTPYLSAELEACVDDTSATVFIHVQGDEARIEDSFSFYNEAEIMMAERVVECLMACRLFPGDIGIISPYEQQVNRLKNKLNQTGIEVKTVDGFQGREKEVVIISLVRSNHRGELGFLTDYRRLNVALTRAKRKLIVIGNADTLGQNTLYKNMIQTILSDKQNMRKE